MCKTASECMYWRRHGLKAKPFKRHPTRIFQHSKSRGFAPSKFSSITHHWSRCFGYKLGSAKHGGKPGKHPFPLSSCTTTNNIHSPDIFNDFWHCPMVPKNGCLWSFVPFPLVTLGLLLLLLLWLLSLLLLFLLLLLSSLFYDLGGYCWDSHGNIMLMIHGETVEKIWSG